MTTTRTIPRRLQRRRTPGWRMPARAVYVGRPTHWGNPFPVARPGDRASHAEAVHRYVVWLAATPKGRAIVAAARRDLKGRDLVCWCPPHLPCHADLLLAVANLGLRPLTVRGWSA